MGKDEEDIEKKAAKRMDEIVESKFDIIFKKLNDHAKENMAELTAKFNETLEDQLDQKLKALKKEIKDDVITEITNLKENKMREEITTLKSKLKNMEDKVNTLHRQNDENQIEHINRHTRINNVEINGVFERDDEDPFDLVCAIARNRGVRCTPADIVATHRISTRKAGAIKPTICHTVCNWKKEEILAAWKKEPKPKLLQQRQTSRYPLLQVKRMSQISMLMNT